MDKMEPMTGIYKLERSDNVEEYLKVLGVGAVLRKVHTLEKPIIEVNHDNSNKKWSIKTRSLFKEAEIEFHIGQKFTDETFDARNSISYAVIERDNLVINQFCNEGPPIKVTITKSVSGLRITRESNEANKCVQIYMKI